MSIRKPTSQMDNVVATIHGSYLQTCHYLGVPFIVDPKTTLNKKLNIHSDVSLDGTEIPRVNYICIGNGGHKISPGINNIPVINDVMHIPKHASLYNQLPFILRPIDNDLTISERFRYRLRRIEQHDGESYVAYYLRKLDLRNITPTIDYRTVTDGNTTSSPFESSLMDLSPNPPLLNPGEVLGVNGDYIAVTAKVPFIMSSEDTEEFVNACRIIYGDERYATISEIGLCSGIDKELPGSFGNVQSTYTDAVAVQISSFINALFQMASNNAGIDMLLDVGSVEPMLITTPLVG